MITVDANAKTVTYNDGVDNAGRPITGMEALLLQLAIDRAAAGTARVSLLQADLRAQTDHIDEVNRLMTLMLNKQPSDPAKEGASIIVDNVGDFRTMLTNAHDQSGATLLSYFEQVNPSSVKLASGKSFNDFMTALKSELNQATNQNQQAMINYQSLINQRNQMTEWVGSLVNL